MYPLTVSFVDLQEVPDLVKHILDEVETSSEHLAGCMEQVGELTFPSVIQCFPKRVGTVSPFPSPESCQQWGNTRDSKGATPEPALVVR